MADTFPEDLQYAKECLKIDFVFNEYQLKAMRSLYELHDTIAVLPTGSGKSVIFQVLPWLLQKPLKADNPLIVIIVSPLNSLMQDQVTSLCERGTPACFLNIDASKVTSFEPGDENVSDQESEEERAPFISSASLKEVREGKYNIIYMHPETIFNKEVGRMLRSPKFRGLVCCTVVDEVHMISEWGPEFRKSFERLGELASLFPSIPHLALTATATPNAVRSLTETLQMRNTTKVLANPDRPNIFIEKKERLSNLHKYEKYDKIMIEITEEMKEKNKDFPVTIVYCDNLETLGYCYQYISYELGKEAYNPNSSSEPEDRIIAQYHKEYTEKMKVHIISELRKICPKIRLVLSTVALGMGLNAPSISRIIHMRPPTTLENYLQEIGRAGRNGQDAVATCFFNNNDIAKNRKGLDDAMRRFILNNETCLRLLLVQHFGYDSIIYNGNPSKCCSNCRSTAG